MRQVGVLYQEEYPKVKSYIIKNNGTEDDAMDVFQESLIQLFRYVKLNKFKEEYDIGAFIFSVARNEWRKRNRTKISFVSFEDHHDQVEEQKNYEFKTEKPSVNASEVIHELLSALGENCRNILSEVIFKKTPMKIIAEKLGYANAAIVKTRHYKCKQRLIKTLEKKPEFLTILKNGISN